MSKLIKIPYKKLLENARQPEKRIGDVGYDTYIAKLYDITSQKKKFIDTHLNSVTLKPLQRIGCGTGIGVDIPKEFILSARMRSGLATWEGISLLNGVGTIDMIYHGEIIIPIINLSEIPVEIKVGDKIAQVLIEKDWSYINQNEQVEFEEVKELSNSIRGANGFGSTGK